MEKYTQVKLNDSAECGLNSLRNKIHEESMAARRVPRQKNQTFKVPTVRQNADKALVLRGINKGQDITFHLRHLGCIGSHGGYELLVYGDAVMARIVSRDWDAMTKLRKQLINRTKRILAVGNEIEQLYCIIHPLGWPINQDPKVIISTAEGKKGLWSERIQPYSGYTSTNGLQLIGPDWEKETHFLGNYVVTFNNGLSDRIVLSGIVSPDGESNVRRAIVYLDSAETAQQLVQALELGQVRYLTLNNKVRAMVIQQDSEADESSRSRVFIYGIGFLTEHQRNVLRLLPLTLEGNYTVTGSTDAITCKHLFHELEAAAAPVQMPQG